MISVDKVIEIFCIADDFCREYSSEVQKHQLDAKDGRKRRNRPCQLSDGEIVAILVCFHFGTFHNFKHYYQFFIKQHLQSFFPTAVSYNRFVELESRVALPMMLMLKLLCFGQCTGITYVDSTCIPVWHNKRIKRNKVFKDYAQVGKSTMGWVYGFKLHLVCIDKGELLNFCLTKANVDDRNPEVFNVLSKDLFGKLYADNGYISKTLFEALFNDGIHLVTGLKSNIKNKLMTLRDKILLRKRSVIETINDDLKSIAQIHRGLPNFLMNMIAALMAYSFFPKKPAFKWDIEKQDQLELFL